MAYASGQITKEQFRNKIDAMKKRIRGFYITIENDQMIVDHDLIKRNAMQTTIDITRLPALREKYEFLIKYPSLMSTDNVNEIAGEFTIYDKNAPSQPWLTVNSDNPDYQCMFTKPFRPYGETQYIVVDLNALANSRKLE